MRFAVKKRGSEGREEKHACETVRAVQESVHVSVAYIGVKWHVPARAI